MKIAIDGTAASGKGTLSYSLSKALKLPRLDTGLLYRKVAFIYIKSIKLSPKQSTADNVQRPTRNWQLLINDPQDNDSPYDTEAIYYELSDTSIHFKYQYYEPWEDPYPNTVSILHINIDNDNQKH